MPIIRFSKADILRTQTMEQQWASFEIVATGDRKNDAGDGRNYDVTFQLIEHKNADLNGKEFKRTFSSKAIGMMIPLIAAVNDTDINTIKEEFDFDIDALRGRKLDGKIITDMYNNRPTNKVEEYLPYKKGVNMVPAF